MGLPSSNSKEEKIVTVALTWLNGLIRCLNCTQVHKIEGFFKHLPNSTELNWFYNTSECGNKGSENDFVVNCIFYISTTRPLKLTYGNIVHLYYIDLFQADFFTKEWRVSVLWRQEDDQCFYIGTLKLSEGYEWIDPPPSCPHEKGPTPQTVLPLWNQFSEGWESKGLSCMAGAEEQKGWGGLCPPSFLGTNVK